MNVGGTLSSLVVAVLGKHLSWLDDVGCFLFLGHKIQLFSQMFRVASGVRRRLPEGPASLQDFKQTKNANRTTTAQEH